MSTWTLIAHVMNIDIDFCSKFVLTQAYCDGDPSLPSSITITVSPCTKENPVMISTKGQ